MNRPHCLFVTKRLVELSHCEKAEVTERLNVEFREQPSHAGLDSSANLLNINGLYAQVNPKPKRYEVKMEAGDRRARSIESKWYWLTQAGRSALRTLRDEMSRGRRRIA